MVLPIGRIDVTLGGGAEKLGVHDDEDGYERAPQGGSVVPVGWSWDYATRIPGAVTTPEEQPVPSVSLVVGDREYSLDETMQRPDGEDGGPLEFSGTAWVGVDAEVGASEIDDAILRVEYDGVTQEVDPSDVGDGGDRGQASLLYRARGVSDASYRASYGLPSLSRDVEWSSATRCTVEVLQTPWFQPVEVLDGDTDRQASQVFVFGQAAPDGELAVSATLGAERAGQQRTEDVVWSVNLQP